jgi:hypothetical protein
MKRETALVVEDNRTGLATYLARYRDVIAKQHAEWRERGLAIKEFWDNLAVRLAEDNVIGKHNEIPNGGMVRKAWERVEAKRLNGDRPSRPVRPMVDPSAVRPEDAPMNDVALTFGRTRKL